MELMWILKKFLQNAEKHYIQFIRELSVKCRQNGLVLSVDNYVPQAYNQQYHRKEQGVFADYVTLWGTMSITQVHRKQDRCILQFCQRRY